MVTYPLLSPSQCVENFEGKGVLPPTANGYFFKRHATVVLYVYDYGNVSE